VRTFLELSAIACNDGGGWAVLALFVPSMLPEISAFLESSGSRFCNDCWWWALHFQYFMSGRIVGVGRFVVARKMVWFGRIVVEE